MIGYFSIREILEAFRECGIWSSFPGDSQMIREESHVCFDTQYNCSLPSFVPNFKILGQVVHEKSLTEISIFISLE